MSLPCNGRVGNVYRGVSVVSVVSKGGRGVSGGLDVE